MFSTTKNERVILAFAALIFVLGAAGLLLL